MAICSSSEDHFTGGACREWNIMDHICVIYMISLSLSFSLSLSLSLSLSKISAIKRRDLSICYLLKESASMLEQTSPSYGGLKLGLFGTKWGLLRDFAQFQRAPLAGKSSQIYIFMYVRMYVCMYVCMYSTNVRARFARREKSLVKNCSN